MTEDLEEVIPTCDICGRAQNDSPNVFDYGETTEVDWNGETGNHQYCELEASRRKTETLRLVREYRGETNPGRVLALYSAIEGRLT